MYNATGQLVLTQPNMTAAAGAIQLPSLPAGMYFVRLSTATTQLSSRFYKE